LHFYNKSKISAALKKLLYLRPTLSKPTYNLGLIFQLYVRYVGYAMHARDHWTGRPTLGLYL